MPPTFLRRPHLDALLNAGTDGPLTVVSAGAGWGKTLATAGWAASGPTVGPVAWVSLDESDNEPRVFLSYLVAALRSVVTLPRDSSLAALVPSLGEAGDKVGRLLRGLAELRGPVVVVLDDFQVIRDESVLASIATLLRHPIPQLRLVLLTRADPTLPLHRLRMSDELTEIRARHLAFSPPDAARLLEAHGTAVDLDDAQLLVGRTEGWPAGLRLAALYLAHPGQDRGAADFAGDDQAVAAYLADEVLASQTPEVQRFLLRTSVAERVSSALAWVLTAQSEGQAHLESLEASNAFVVGLGPGREWFRYHALLREMLQHRLKVLEPDVVPELHRSAAAWFTEHGHPLEALRHAAEAEDWVLFGRLFVSQALPLLVSVDRTALDGVLARVPGWLLDSTPELALCAAARHLYAGRFDQMEQHLAVARTQLDELGDDAPRVTAIAWMLLSTAVARSLGNTSGLRVLASQTLDWLDNRDRSVTPQTGRDFRAIALGNLGTGLLWDGRLVEAEERLREALAATENTRLEVTKVGILSNLALLAAATGRLREGFSLATRAVEVVDARGWAPLAQSATAYLALSTIHLQWNNLDEAQGLLAQGRAASAGDRAPRFALALGQARLDVSLGRVDMARERVTLLARELGDWPPATYLSRWLAITQAEVDLASGDPSSAAVRVKRASGAEPLLPRERVCLARALLAGGHPQEADGLLEEVRTNTTENGAQVDAWVLTSLVADRVREDNRALEALGRAVELAEREGARRPFVVLDPEHVPRLLARLRQLDARSAGFADELLADVGRDDPDSGRGETLSEPLTDRELTVLKFLPTMMTNPEIADELYVSVNTVKAHLKRIYRKLDVTSRRQAVHRARDLGLVDD